LSLDVQNCSSGSHVGAVSHLIETETAWRFALPHFRMENRISPAPREAAFCRKYSNPGFAFGTGRRLHEMARPDQQFASPLMLHNDSAHPSFLHSSYARILFAGLVAGTFLLEIRVVNGVVGFGWGSLQSSQGE
jgi:hypothetical protein